MVSIKKFILNKCKALAYFKFNLEKVNALSNNLLELIKSQKGEFFSYLPSSTKPDEENNLSHAINFRGLDDIIENIILEKLISNNNLFCVFDDYLSSFEADDSSLLLNNHGFFHEKEVYYAINHENANRELIQECFYASRTGWHSLCFLSSFNFLEISDKKLSLQNIKEISTNTDLIIIEAYDGEGYACWRSIK